MNKPIKQFLIDNKTWVLAEHHFEAIKDLEAKVEELEGEVIELTCHSITKKCFNEYVKRYKSKLEKAREGLEAIEDNCEKDGYGFSVYDTAKQTLKELEACDE